MTAFSLAELEVIVAARANAPAAESYTASLITKGPLACAKKFGEEAVEAVIAGAGDDTKALVAESADVLYHLLVLWRARGVAHADVMAELERRTTQSGHAEKAARPKA